MFDIFKKEEIHMGQK